MIKAIYRQVRKKIADLQTYYLSSIGFYNGHSRLKLLTNEEANSLIIKEILSEKPLMISRYGSVEFKTFTVGSGFKALCNNAGFFPKENKLIKKFQMEYFESSHEIDILGVWYYKYGSLSHWKRKKELIRVLPNISHLIHLHVLNPYDNGWISALKNKRVLVVHPFKASIEKQYIIRKKIGLLPELKSFEVIQAVQTIADAEDTRFKDWFEALKYMKDEISQKDFDICLIGCGAYGLPLAAHVKRIGKQGIHIGGALQLLFGIKGKRWEVEYDFKFDESWIYPLEADRPDGAEKVENACYW